MKECADVSQVVSYEPSPRTLQKAGLTVSHVRVKTNCIKQGCARTSTDGLTGRAAASATSWLVDFLAVSDACNIHGFFVVFDRINDAVVANANAPFIHAAFVLFTPGRARIVGKYFDAPRNTRQR